VALFDLFGKQPGDEGGDQMQVETNDLP